MTTVADGQRKRRWDATEGQPGAQIGGKDTDGVAHQSVPNGGTAREFEINDHPGHRFAMMSTNIRAVERRHDVIIVSKGRYVPPEGLQPPADARDADRKLFLKIRGPSQLQVDAAVEDIKTVMARGMENPRPDRIWADMEVAGAPGLDVLDRLQGLNREYLDYIEKETGASVKLAGRGTQDEGRDALHISIRAPNAAGSARARSLSISLIKTVQPVYDDYRHRYFGIVRPLRKGCANTRWLSGGGGPYRGTGNAANAGRPAVADGGLAEPGFPNGVPGPMVVHGGVAMRGPRSQADVLPSGLLVPMVGNGFDSTPLSNSGQGLAAVPAQMHPPPPPPPPPSTPPPPPPPPPPSSPPPPPPPESPPPGPTHW